MAIKLKVETNQATFRVNDPDTVNFTAEQGIPIYPNDYTGSYNITPAQNTQILKTEGLMMSRDVIINPIPSNYGLIAWNGSTLTVS